MNNWEKKIEPIIRVSLYLLLVRADRERERERERRGNEEGGRGNQLCLSVALSVVWYYNYNHAMHIGVGWWWWGDETNYKCCSGEREGGGACLSVCTLCLGMGMGQEQRIVFQREKVGRFLLASNY